MSKIHYFQRYNAKENWATNSTLLLLSRLYYYNRLKFEKVINAILEESNLSLNIGVDFRQQEWGKHSVVDGIISQDSFKVVIETKLYDKFTADQLKRHLEALTATPGKKILLALSKNKVSNDIRNEVIKALQDDTYKGVEFAATTYQIIIETIQDFLADYEIEMREILEDFVLLCQEHGLTDIENHTLLVFSATTSLAENFKFNIYYDQATRSHNLPFKYVGLYANKSIVGIGKLNKIVFCDYVDGNLIATNGTILELTTNEYNRIKDTIEQTDYYNLKEGSKFFLVDNFYKTDFKKTSFSSLRGKRYFFLEDIESFNETMTAEQIATLLNGKTWE